MHHNVGNMARMGLRRTSLSSYNKIDARDEIRKPPKPLLAIACVGHSYLFVYHCFNIVE